MRGTFLLDVHDLDSAGKAYTAPVTADWLRKALEGCGDVQPTAEAGEVSVRYSRTGSDVVVKGTVQAHLQSPCSRCLEPAKIDIDTEITLLLVPAASPKAGFAAGKAALADAKGDEYELQPGDAELDTYEGETVVLDPFVREAILLEIPSTPLCSENCQGIAPPPDQSASAGPSLDPRLAPLLKFQKKGN